MTNKREQDYLLIRQKASIIIQELFQKNGNFSKLNRDYIEELRTKYHNKSYRFKYVVRKYFMNVTFNFNSIPFKYVLPVFDFYLRKKFSPTYKKVIEEYEIDFVERCKQIRSYLPNLISSEEDISQIIKLIMACTLTTYITYPTYNSRKATLKNSYLSGFYLGIAYLISDKQLDSPKLSDNEKLMLNNDILNFLSDPMHYSCQHPLIKLFANEVIEHFDPEIYQSQFEILFYLQKIQFEDLQFQIDNTSIQSIIDKCINTGLKTFLSLQAVQSCGKNFDLHLNFEINFLFSLLVQLDDDLRDIKKDRDDNIQTIFTHPFDRENFSPHLLYLELVNIFVKKNKNLSWLYTDYFLHLENIENNRGFDHDKIKLFIEKTTSIKLEDIACRILK
jgi:hypothetical protein